MQIANLIMALPGAAAQGLIWGIMAIGVYLTFRVLDIADLTVDGTMCTGGAVCVMMMTSGHNVWVSLFSCHFGWYDSWSCYRYFPYLYGNPGHPCRNPDTAFPVLC